MKLDVFYVTYRQDLCWICYSAQLLQKFFRSPFRTIICANRDCEDVLSSWGLSNTTYHYVDPWPDGYAFAMYLKTMADQYSDADLIMVLDSDHLLLEPVYLDQFSQNGKPIIRYRSWDSNPNDALLQEGRRQWVPPTERVMGIPLDRDYMLGPPFLMWRETFSGVRNRIEDVTGLSFHDAVYSNKPYHHQNFLTHPKVYCDYESLGLYAAKFEPDRYSLVPYHPGHWPFRVYWSHGDWNEQLRAELDQRLTLPLIQPFNGDRFVLAEIADLVRRHKIQTIIETGTYYGVTTRILASLVPRVITIEISEEYPSQHLDHLGNVTRLTGDSAQVLPNILAAGPQKPVLFYLDAHWKDHSPLLDELGAIAEAGYSFSNSVIVIHDFKNPEHPEFGYDSWDIGPYTEELIEPVLTKIYGRFASHFNRQAEGDCRGLIYVEPRHDLTHASMLPD